MAFENLFLNKSAFGGKNGGQDESDGDVCLFCDDRLFGGRAGFCFGLQPPLGGSRGRGVEPRVHSALRLFP